MSVIRLDRDAFRRGVEDAMTFAPLREVVRQASNALTQRRSGDGNKEPPTGSAVYQSDKVNDGKSSHR